MEWVALYLHTPFCLHKCPYCDFNAYSGLGRLVEPFVQALDREIANWSPLLRGYQIPTVFLGGGTPSLLSGTQVAAILHACRQAFALAPHAEISLEANPGTLDLPRLEAYRAAGVNRLSLGAQSFHKAELRWLGRDHTADQTREAVALARAAGFENINLDLIFGLPGQTLCEWEASLREALGLRPEHLSLYALTVEEGTPLARRVASGRVPTPDGDAQAEQYERAEDLLDEAGFVHYEVSNWARPGYESRHNLTYWRNEPYVGVGPGAHSYFGGYRFSTVRSPGEYIRRVARPHSFDKLMTAPSPLPEGEGIPARAPIAEIETVDPKTDLFDTLTQGLRLIEGVDLAAVRRRHGAFDETSFSRLCEQGLVEREGDWVRLTRRGRLLANEVSLALLP